MQKTKIYVALIVVGIIICMMLQLNGTYEICDLGADDENVELLCELEDGIVVKQTLLRPYEYINSIYLNCPTFSDRARNGILQISVYNNGHLVGEASLSVEQIYDNIAVEIPLIETKGNCGDLLEIEMEASSEVGKAIGIWKIQNDNVNLLNACLEVNGVEVEGITSMAVECETGKMCDAWLYLCIFAIGVIIVGGYAEKLYFFAVKPQVISVIYMLCFGMVVLYFRSARFEAPYIYAEDGLYLSRLLNDGFFGSAFMTRSGRGNDFLNLGSYILLYLSLMINRCIFGFNLLNLPLVIGWVSNLFWTIVAIVVYFCLKDKSKVGAFAMYCTTLLVPMGISGAEVFGRVLNEVFIFPVLACVVLMLLWERRYESSGRNMILQFVLMICGFSFPISFGAIAIWIFLGFFVALKEKNIVIFLRANIINLTSVVFMLVLLPTMLGSEGASAGMEITISSLIEFILARHFLFGFIYFGYNLMNDIVVVLLFLLTISLVGWANITEWMKHKELTKYNVFSIISIACIGASALMRIKMSSMFVQYTSSYPDRYYYGCNLLFILLVFYAIFIVVKKRIFVNLCVFLYVGFLCMNPHLYYDREDGLWINGNSDESTWEECLENAEDSVLGDGATVAIYTFPNTNEKQIEMDIPINYYLDTMMSIKTR